MTTLPPEGQDGQPAVTPPTPAEPAPAEHAQLPEPELPAPTPPAPAATPLPPAPPVMPPAPSAAPPAPPAAPQAPQYAAPQQPSVQPPQYSAPPTSGGYQTPPPGYQAPPPGYQTPPPGGYQQPPAGYQQPVSDPVSNITLNYWLSVFFTWVPALIFFIVEKDKGNQRAYVFHRDNLNFSLLRTGVMIGMWIFSVIPFIGGLIATLLGIGLLVLFIFHIIAAAKAPEAYRRGEAPGFVFNAPMVK